MPSSCSRTPISRRRRTRDVGFTLAEVVLALLVLALATVVLLDRRVGIVQEAALARDARMLWVLGAQKVAELELDKTIWSGQGGSNNGDFSELGDEFATFEWEYDAERIEIPINDPTDLEEKPKEIFKLTVRLYSPGQPVPYVVETLVPIFDPASEQPAPGTPGESPPGTPPGTTPAPAPPGGSRP